MRHALALVISVFLVVAMGREPVLAQTRWHYREALGDLRKIQRRSHDDTKLRQYLEESIPEIPSHNWKTRNLRIFMTLQLADLYLRASDLVAAERLNLSAVEMVRSTSTTWRRSRLPFLDGTIFKAYDQLAYFYLNTGNFRKARQLFLQSASRRSAVFPGKSVFLVSPIVGLGSLHYREGTYDSARLLFTEAFRMLSRATTTLYDYDRIRRVLLKDLAELSMAAGRANEAWGYLEQLSASSSGANKFRSVPESRMETARVLEMKARFFLLQDDLMRAQEYLDRAEKFTFPGVRVSDVWFKIRKTQAVLYWRQGNLEKADEHLLLLAAAYRDHIRNNFVAMTEYEREQFYKTLKADLNLMNSYALIRQEARLFEEIYDHTLATKALLLNEINKMKSRLFESKDKKLINAFRQWQQAKGQLSSLYYADGTEADADSIEALIESLEKEINGRSSLFRNVTGAPVWTSVRNTLEPDEAAVEVIRIRLQESLDVFRHDGSRAKRDSIVYLALMVKSDSETPEYILLSNGRELEGRFLAYYRNCIQGRIRDEISYEQFWRPLAARLKETKRIYFSPDGVFSQINLNTMLNPASGEYVLDEIELVYVTNTADLLKKNPIREDNGRALLMGNPLFGADVSYPAVDDTIQSGMVMRDVLSESFEAFRDQDFPPLPGTAIELDLLAAALVKKDLRVATYTGADAREERVKAVVNPLILHIATHGFFIEDEASHINPLIRSGLVLAGAETMVEPGQDDGILTAYEATNLNLEGTALVTLSACETGVGEVRNGQGVYGLQRAIIIAGAANVLMSLWKVDDEATARLMARFYERWNAGKDQPAFREAQKELRLEYPHPFYWGAFIMLGK